LLCVHTHAYSTCYPVLPVCLVGRPQITCTTRRPAAGEKTHDSRSHEPRALPSTNPTFSCGGPGRGGSCVRSDWPNSGTFRMPRGASAFPHADTRHKPEPRSKKCPLIPPPLAASSHSQAPATNVPLRPTCFCTVTVASPGFGAADGDARRMRHEQSSRVAARGRGRQRQRQRVRCLLLPTPRTSPSSSNLPRRFTRPTPRGENTRRLGLVPMLRRSGLWVGGSGSAACLCLLAGLASVRPPFFFVNLISVRPLVRCGLLPFLVTDSPCVMARRGMQGSGTYVRTRLWDAS
jgi:hypothetical protein